MLLNEERVSGPAMRVFQVALPLRRMGIELIVVIPKGDPTFASLLRDAQIPYREMGLVRLRYTLNPLAHARYLVRFWPNVKALRQMIREHAAEVVHVNGLLNIQGAIAAKLEGVPLEWHLMDFTAPWPLRPVVLWMMRRWADQISVSSKAVADVFFPDASAQDGRFRVMYAPVDVNKFTTDVDGSAVRAEFGIPPHSPVIGTVANVCPGKGFEYLLEAALQIKDRHPATKFLLVGAMLESRRGYWRRLHRQAEKLGIANDVIFTGLRLDIPQIMRALTVYVHPSEAEGCGMSIMEASASGLPVVATDVGGPRELIQNGVTGLLIESRQPSQIADAVIRLLDSSETARRMGMAGVDRMRNIFSLESCVDVHVKVYSSAIAHRAATRATSHAHRTHSKARASLE